MKTRCGFVSNSSSSSFLIVSRKDLSKEFLLHSFGISETSPFAHFASSMAQTIMRLARKYDLIEELAEDDFCGNVAYIPEAFKPLIEKWKKEDLKLYYGVFYNGEDETTEFLNQWDLNFETDQMEMAHLRNGF